VESPAAVPAQELTRQARECFNGVSQSAPGVVFCSRFWGRLRARGAAVLPPPDLTPCRQHLHRAIQNGIKPSALVPQAELTRITGTVSRCTCPVRIHIACMKRHSDAAFWTACRCGGRALRHGAIIATTVPVPP
jgi:hypothetical protein